MPARNRRPPWTRGGTNNSSQNSREHPLQANAWSHTATTFDGFTHWLFVNGVQVASVAAAGSLWQTTAPFRIGGNSLWGGWFEGAIDDSAGIQPCTEPHGDSDRHEYAGGLRPPQDTTPPNVAISTPVTGATVSGTVGVVATAATDNVGVASVQFLLNGANLGGTGSAAPYTVTVNTQQEAPGTADPDLTEVARDHSGNANVSSDVVVTVRSNASPVRDRPFHRVYVCRPFSSAPDRRRTISGYTLEVWLAGANTSTGRPTRRSSSLGKPASSTTAMKVTNRRSSRRCRKGRSSSPRLRRRGPEGRRAVPPPTVS